LRGETFLNTTNGESFSNNSKGFTFAKGETFQHRTTNGESFFNNPTFCDLKLFAHLILKAYFYLKKSND
jgi:hypothetical protein